MSQNLDLRRPFLRTEGGRSVGFVGAPIRGNAFQMAIVAI